MTYENAEEVSIGVEFLEAYSLGRQDGLCEEPFKSLPEDGNVIKYYLKGLFESLQELADEEANRRYWRNVELEQSERYRPDEDDAAESDAANLVRIEEVAAAYETWEQEERYRQQSWTERIRLERSVQEARMQMMRREWSAKNAKAAREAI